MSYKLFLDDIRMPDYIYPNTSNNDWVIARDVDEFKAIIEKMGIPSFISFDNDLGAFENGEPKPEGKDAAKWMAYEMGMDISDMEFKVHSSNIGGPREDIAAWLNNWKKELIKRKDEMGSSQIRKEVRKILVATHGPILSSAVKSLKEIQEHQKNALTSILNSLEFKNDIINAGGEIYAVGGIVRDAVMGKPSDDLDIVVRGVPYDKLFTILSKYGKATDTSVVDENGKKDFGATKFVSNNEAFNAKLAASGIRKDIDVMLPRKDMKRPGEKGHRSIKSDVNPMYTIQDDLMRRDITINAIALDLNGNLIDNGHAVKDIQNGIIRMVSEDSFFEDPLRMVRAVRFAAKFNFQWDEKTLELMRANANLLSDKKELPRERFLLEFEKMIGKSDLGRAVKLLVDLGLYQAMFKVEPHITDFKKFDKASSVAEFSYMLFEHQPANKIIQLATENITNEIADIKYLEALIKYLANVKGKNLDKVAEINALANIYNTSPAMLLNSSYVDHKDMEIAEKFATGAIPKSQNDIAFKGEEFKNFIADTINATGAEFNERKDGAKMGKAKTLALQAVYGNVIPNQKEAIKQYLINNSDSWLA
jgi:tRNA nucleotidyltransferase/poly(A) polymerase